MLIIIQKSWSLPNNISYSEIYNACKWKVTAIKLHAMALLIEFINVEDGHRDFFSFNTTFKHLNDMLSVFLRHVICDTDIYFFYSKVIFRVLLIKLIELYWLYRNYLLWIGTQVWRKLIKPFWVKESNHLTLYWVNTACIFDHVCQIKICSWLNMSMMICIENV